MAMYSKKQGHKSKQAFPKKNIDPAENTAADKKEDKMLAMKKKKK